MSPDFYIDTIRILKAKGMTALEAVRQIGRDEIGRSMTTDVFGTKQGRELLDLLVEAGMEEDQEKNLEQAYELWMAGWTHEPVTPDSRVMSWYWRAPAKGKRLKGASVFEHAAGFERPASKRPIGKSPVAVLQRRYVFPPPHSPQLQA